MISEYPHVMHDNTFSGSLNELCICGDVSALKLSLLSDSLVLSKRSVSSSTAEEFALRLGYAEDQVRNELESLVHVGFFEKLMSADSVRFRLNTDGERVATVRRFVAAWRDLRFHLRAFTLLSSERQPHSTPL